MANIKFQNALQLKPQAVPPIWFMRQAGRYHSHYQKLKSKHSFMELCKNPELAAQVALGPVVDFDFDVAIMFSDLLFPLEALGMGLTYAPGPVLSWRLNEKTIKDLRPWQDSVPHLEFQAQVLRQTRDLLPLDKSLIGFVGGPFTLFAYAVEGGHKGHLIQSKSQPPLFAEFNQALVPLLAENIALQLAGGAEVVMIFDTAAGELSPQNFATWCGEGLNQLATRFRQRLIYYSKGTQAAHLRVLQENPHWLGFGYDHGWSLADVLKDSSGQLVQGNFDQSLLFMPPDLFHHHLNEYLRPLRELSVGERAGWICGLGHGVLPETPEDNVRHFITTVREVFA